VSIYSLSFPDFSLHKIEIVMEDDQQYCKTANAIETRNVPSGHLVLGRQS
jgi:hypothetical protein